MIFIELEQSTQIQHNLQACLHTLLDGNLDAKLDGIHERLRPNKKTTEQLTGMRAWV